MIKLVLQDIIKEQQGMMKKMQEKMEGQKGEGKMGKEEMSGDQFQMYKEQKMLKEQMQQLMDRQGKGGSEGKAALQQMENLEKILLEKGIGKEALERMQKLEHELLELENANLKRNEESKRKSSLGEQKDNSRAIDELDLENFDLNDDEMLRRQRLEMTPEYQKKVKRYFETENNPKI